jgi:hypothetical protein
MLAGQKTCGGTVSRTVTVKEQDSLEPPRIAVVQVTVVAPTANCDPEGGAQLTAPQAPDVVGE